MVFTFCCYIEYIKAVSCFNHMSSEIMRPTFSFPMCAPELLHRHVAEVMWPIFTFLICSSIAVIEFRRWGYMGYCQLSCVLLCRSIQTCCWGSVNSFLSYVLLHSCFTQTCRWGYVSAFSFPMCSRNCYTVLSLRSCGLLSAFLWQTCHWGYVLLSAFLCGALCLLYRQLHVAEVM